MKTSRKSRWQTAIMSYRCVCSVLLSILAGVASVSAQSGNLVQGGFEDGWLHWNVYQSPGVWSITIDGPHGGAKSAQFGPVSPGYYDAAIRSDLFTLQAGTTYHLSAAIREQNTHDTGSSSMTIFDIGLGQQGGGWYAPLPGPNPSSTWQTVETFYTPVVNQVMSLEIQIHGYATGSPAWATIDDVYVIAVPEPSSLALIVFACVIGVGASALRKPGLDA